eukprot:COSAG06_NODE_6397_length_2948_cov_3.873289_1_plen_117_part_00
MSEKVWLYHEHFTDDDGVVTKVHHTVVTKVFAKSFQATCEGEDVKGVSIELERKPKVSSLLGVWQFFLGPIVNDKEFELFQTLHTIAARLVLFPNLTPWMMLRWQMPTQVCGPNEF